MAVEENKEHPVRSLLMIPERLKTPLLLIEACFKYLDIDKSGPLKYSFTYHYGEDRKISGIQDIIMEIKDSIKYQAENNKVIDISAWLLLKQDLIVRGENETISYVGLFHLFTSAGFVRFQWNQSSPSCEFDLNNDLTPKNMLDLYIHIQDAFHEQLETLVR